MSNNTYLTTEVTSSNVDLRLVNETDDLNVVLGVEPLSTSDSTRRNEASAVSRRGTPCYFTLFGGTCP